MKDFVVTTSFKTDPEKLAEAVALANAFQVPYLERGKASIRRIIGDKEGALVVYKDKLLFRSNTGETLSFHPDTAMLRIKAPRDPLSELIGSSPFQILDTTMGLASDSIVMAYAGHQVTALESDPLIHLIVSQGLKRFVSGNDQIDHAMRRIKTQCVDSLAFLKAAPDQSVDVIYCDPMFSENITESENLSGLASLANPARMTPEFLAEAKRVARQKIILKAHFKDSSFETLGFDRLVRPNTKFHFGVIDVSSTRLSQS
ncbi:class I SAM-dependent methyltransferase [Streptococcus moroccensis]|uniref:16S rRNA G966 N2-methylase RsmD n=1 Tax=Streptococcus moroccensis TaxID=1451356 RepID=A0ABT9YRP6_9STRE|nr:class I SAM-dependent methyltransferase [Streptococcus moroccensis]MDQ0222668.1 16S rRNA G966 N2-methylase RsmD [Streptococcus moroccensis]